MALSISDKINIGRVSAHLASVDVLNSALYGRKLDPRLPLMLQIETDAIEWRYLVSPTDITLIATTNYLIELCGNYGNTAQTLIAGGGGGTVITPVTPSGYIYVSLVFTVSATDLGNGTPYDGSFVWVNPIFIGAQQLSYLIIDNTIETNGLGFTLDTVLGTIDRSPNVFFTGSVISVSFMKKL
jgi:hypothetical protein